MTESNALTLVKPWSTWVITSKTSSKSPMTCLIKSTHTCGQTWSNPRQRCVKTLMFLNFPGTFAAFSKFYPYTSNSTIIKVVQFFMEHNFHVEWHFKFEVEIGVKACQHQQLRTMCGSRTGGWSLPGVMSD
jgi:hypothetical protein